MINPDPTLPGESSATDEHSAPQRRIRSFVLRMGRMTAGQQRALAELWPRYGIEYTPATLDLDHAFGRRAPRLIEIGFGSGEALFAYAQAHPEVDCLGIEVHRPGAGHLLLQVHQAGMTNMRVSCHDAVEVLTQQLTPASIDAVHILFPDPWHKKRHHKRRLIQTEFVDVLAHVIKSGGVLRLATDWQDYAEHMRAVLDTHAQFANAAAAGYAARPDERPVTRFERRGQRLGHGVWDMEYQRR
jgi:tRNA (guanine-N7-)-methyltransferase